MGSLTTCLKAAGNLLSAEHRTAIMERARELRADGLKPADAAQRAVDEMIADVQDKLIAAGDERTIAADMQPTGVAEAIVDEFPGIDRRAVAQAVEAGMTEVEIRDAIDEDMADGDVAAATQSLFEAIPTDPDRAETDEKIHNRDADKEQANGQPEVPGDGPQTLEGVATPEGGATEGGGGSGIDAAGGVAPVRRGSRKPAVNGVSGARGRGGRVAPVHPAEAGIEGPRNRRATQGAGGKRSAVPTPAQVEDLFTSPAPEPVQVPAANFIITPALKLGVGSEAEKYRDNLNAIRVLKLIEDENRRATSDEQHVLARWVGWGGLANVFPNPQTGKWKPEWEARGKELKALLTPKEYKRASNSTTDAHFTSETVTTALWDAVKRLGYRGGLAIELSVGSGNFIGLMPGDVAGQTRFVGIEMDSITARIAKALYPQASILESGTHRVPIPNGAFDLDIGNPPFGQTSITWQYKPEYRGLSIHNQFFLAGLDALKPGGIMAKVVSRYLLDATDRTAREMMATKGKLLGAIRLPESAFKENARTEVITDIVFFQRLTAAEEATMKFAFEAKNSKAEKDWKAEKERRELADQVPGWVYTSTVPDPAGGESMVVNSYFAENPHMVVGTMDRTGSMQHGADVTVKLAKDADFAAELRQRVEQLPEGVMDRSDEAIQASIDRFKAMADGLEIAVAGHEPGHMAVNADGKLEQIFERETPEGDFEFARRVVTPASPWSKQLFMDDKGNWFRNVPKLDADGKQVKLLKKDGTPGKLNAYTREVFGGDDKVPDTLRLGQTDYQRLRDATALRDLMKAQLVLEAQDAPSDKLEAHREELAKAYDAYVKAHGFVSEAATSSVIAEMPDAGLIQALELSYKPAISKEKAARTGDKPREAQAQRAPILSRRVVVPYEAPTGAESVSDAMQISLSERGVIDVERMATLLGKTKEEVSDELTSGDRPMAFQDPETQRIEPRDSYLTGEVKRKLRAAQDAGLAANVTALQAVQPEPITSDNVTAILGSSWVPADTYADFLQHLTGDKARVVFEPLTNTYSVRATDTVKAKEWASIDEGGRVRVTASNLVQDALNSQPTKVTYTDSDGNTHTDTGATELAAIKRKEIEREFSDWVFADGERRRMLVERFNEKFNTRVVRQYDGSHLDLPGKVPDEIVSLRRHQKNAIWRGVTERFMLYDHVVGAGKTYTAIARAMERRRMGLSRKPMIVVPNHMVEQFAADVYKLYPGAKVLAAGKKDFEKRARRRLFGKIATGDWDIVVVPHSSFGFISLAPETEDAFLQEELNLALKALKDAEAEAEPGTRFKPVGVKKAEALVKKIEARIDAIKSKEKDRLLTFEQMGVDDITVDEAHEFKNLFYSSRMSVRGMGDQSGSQKAFDLYTKIRYLRSTPTGSVTFMTGTPISNSAVEMYTMMRYLAADELRALGLEHFDSWRTQFVDASTAYEQQMTGGVKEVGRLGRTWSNARSLMNLYYSFTDAVTTDDIKKAFAEDNPGKEFPIPNVKGGERRQILVKPTKAQSEIQKQVFQDYEALDGIQDPKERNAERLRLMDRARKLSLDIRVVDPKHPSDEKGGKLERVAQEVARIYKDWTKDLGTQLVFLDRSVPHSKGDDAQLKAYDKLVAEKDAALAKNDEEAYREAVEALDAFDQDEITELRNAKAGGWNAYQQIKDNLIAQGIPAREIRFIQEANNDAQKQAIFDGVKDGSIRVLIGSTPRMGAGTNVQNRLVGLHHVDVGWKPSDIEQREGRIIRQENELYGKYGKAFEVEILSYATETTSDASMWALNSMKLKTINGIRKYDGSFTMDFEDEDSLSMAQMAALASGDPLLLERIQLVGKIDKLERQENAHRRRVIGLTDSVESTEHEIKTLPNHIERFERDAAKLAAGEAKAQEAFDQRSVTVEGQRFKAGDGMNAERAALEAVAGQQAGDEKAKFAITIDGKRVTSKTGISNAIHDALGDVIPFEATVFGEKKTGRAAAVRDIVEKARELAGNLDRGDSKGFDIGEALDLKLVGDVSRSSWGSGGYTLAFSLVDKAGRTIYSVESNQTEKHDFSAQFARATFDRLFPNGPLSDTLTANANYYARQLRDKQGDLPEMKRQLATVGAFKSQQELDAKRTRLAEVVRELTVGKGVNLQHIDNFGSLFQATPPASVQDDFGNEVKAEHRPMFMRGASESEANALKALSENDELFSLPKPTGETVESIAAEIDPQIKVKKYNHTGGRTDYTFTMPDGNSARMVVREPNRFGPQLYGYDLADGEMQDQITERPGDNPEDVDPDKGDVWIDVSLLESGGGGGKIYAVASAFAHNTGRIFIGDPASLSDEAMRRRPEQMLSSALKYGTTEHLAPHPRQITGDKALGVPPLRWIYGDDVGNIRRLVELNVKALQNAGLDDTSISFDPASGQFQDSGREPISRADISALAKATNFGEPGLAAGGTIARGAVWRALLRQEGREGPAGRGRDGLLAGLARLGSNFGAATKGIFYSRGADGADKPVGQQQLEALTGTIAGRWENAPTIKWVDGLQDAAVPQEIRDEDAQQRSQGASGVPKGFFYKGTVYLVRGQIKSEADAAEVLFHEALGHAGLRGVFGKALKDILDVVAVGRSLDMQRKAKEYGKDLSNLADRRVIAEEVLAELAQTKPNSSLVQRAIAAIRQFLRKLGFRLELSDNDLIANYILPARRFIEGGGKMENESGMAPFIRGDSSTPAFARKPSLQSLLRKFGRMPSDRMDVVRSWNDGDRLFYSHDMEESKPTEAKTLDDLEGYAPDQILILPKGAGSVDVPMFSRSADILTSVRDAKLPAGYMVNDFIKSSGKVSWWDKTVGTMHNLAQRNPLFKPVYDAANTFLNDVSFFAASSADLAPTLLPKLEKLRDIGKAPLSAEDTRAISAPIFEGTLEWTRDKDGTPVKEDDAAKAGIVWTDAELREKFGLNAKQIELYREFRRATNQSLTNLVLSDVVRFGGKDLLPVRDAVLAAKTIGAASNIVQEHLATLIEQADPKRAAVLSDTGTRITEKLEQAHKMIQRGYAPLMRFGTYTLDATDADGKRIYFGLFESQADANRFARQLAAEYKGANISQGTLSEQAYQMFAGVSPETLELFGGMLGLEAQGNDASSIAFQEYLKLAKSNRSAMKRLIKRKGTEGFSEDAGRVLAGFVYSNARQTSKNLHLGGMTSAVQKIADVKGQGELLDVAVKLQQYVSNPQEEAQAIRGLMFANFLGGSLAAGIVNLSQTVMVTAPYLTKFTSASAAAKTMAGALKDAARWEMSKNPTTGDAKLDAAIRRAEEEGVISPQEVHGLIAQAGGKAALKAGDGTMAGNALAKASNGLSKFMLLWGRPFAVAEQFNRRTTFIAAYRVAVDKGMSNPAAFAEKAINDTQFVYCVDHETECLTNRGWMRRDDLRVGDAVIGVDSKGAAVPTKLLGLHIFKGPQRAIRFSNNTRFSMVLTPGHDALVQSYNSRDQKWQDLRKVKAGELKRSHHLLRTPTAPVQRPDSVGADMAALLGWIAAEGNYAKFRNCVHRTNVRITQSIKHNPEYVEEIESILRRLGGHYRKFIVKKGEMAIFTLRKPLSDSVRESMPEKILTWRMAETMSQTEMGSLVDAFARGDGTLADEGGWVIAQKDTRNLDVLQAMAIMCGRSATFYPATDSDGGKVAHLYLHKNTLRSHVKALDQESVEIDGAWCPETESGTWIARRNGAVFVTGNSKANRPQWARGAIGGTLFTFKTYAISYVELLSRMAGSGKDGRKAALIGLAMLVMVSGIDGLPGAGDLDDLIDGLLQRLGYNFSSKRKRHEFLASILGEGGAKFVEKGISGLPGAPIDVSGRLGLGNLIPGTGLFLKKTDHTRDVAELAGPAGGLAANWFAGTNAAVQGDFGQALQSFAPVAAANLFKAYDMASTGMYRDTRGRKVLDVDGFDAMAKGIGFQPNDVARVQAAAGQVQSMVGLVKMREGEIADKWARGVFERKPDEVRSAREELATWNADNPEAPIKINSAQIIKRVREMGTGRDERLAKTAPREIRATVRRELEAAR